MEKIIQLLEKEIIYCEYLEAQYKREIEKIDSISGDVDVKAELEMRKTEVSAYFISCTRALALIQSHPEYFCSRGSN